MKTQQEITEAIELLKQNKANTNRRSTFGDDNHRALDCMIKTLENGWDENDMDDKFPNDTDYENGTSILSWKNSDTEILEDFLYPENK